ncbi:MAG: polysaccharide biosynthesis/export family protein [Deltaproteobacteria bacterium]|nr:polysaccharide biosynthesis/export family protein [Deltaproteobacteria bacterium]
MSKELLSINLMNALLKKWVLHFLPYIFAAILSLSILQSCYQSTAVKGIPVTDMKSAKDPRIYKKITTYDSEEALSPLQNLKENKTFKHIDNVPEYRIGPTDVLEIISHVGNEATSTLVTVNANGKISYSFIDDVKAAGLTPSELDELLTERLSNFLKKPRLNVLVKEFKSKSVTVLGEFAALRASNLAKAASGRIFLEGKTTLMDLVAMAGGYTVDADIKNVKIVRQGRTYRVNLYDILEKGDESKNIIIDDGDVLDIPALPAFGERVYVMGEVESQGIYSLKDAKDVLGAISLAGGVTTLAVEENTLIVRGYPTGEAPLVMMSDLNALFRQADLRQNVSLEDGDLVYVPRMLIGDINDWIANTTPLLDFIFYPKRLQDAYFTRDYLHINRR